MITEELIDRMVGQLWDVCFSMEYLIIELEKLKKELKMDKQISKVKKDLDKGEKDVKKLQKMDKVFDKKLEKASIIKKKK